MGKPLILGIGEPDVLLPGFQLADFKIGIHVEGVQPMVLKIHGKGLDLGSIGRADHRDRLQGGRPIEGIGAIVGFQRALKRLILKSHAGGDPSLSLQNFKLRGFADPDSLLTVLQYGLGQFHGFPADAVLFLGKI